ncbi:MAG: ComEC/Rec2 family competence protein [bacterium]|nr:ComEC/Rec2 family competence protein [bacterium]
MKLAILFASFLLGLLTGADDRFSELSLLPFILIAASLIPIFIRQIPSFFHIVFFGLASFFLGMIWIIQLPTWPKPLNPVNPTPGRVCTIIGTATGSEFECSGGRFLPVSIEIFNDGNPPDETCGTQGQWIYESGIVLAVVPRDFVGLPGARYEIHGFLDNSPDTLQGPFLLRYSPRAIIRPLSFGPYVNKIDEPDDLANFSNRLRYRLMSHLSWGISLRESELVAGITFGRKGRRISGSWANDFYQAGLSHLIVASGAQVSLLFLPIMFFLTLIRLPKILNLIFLACLAFILFGFAKLLGGEPSILRAAVMGTILLLSLGLERRTFGLSTLVATGWFWLLANPLLIRDIGFLLSFGACFGIIYLSPPLFEKFLSGNQRLVFAPGLSIMSIVINSCIYTLRWLQRLFTGLSIITITAQIGVVPILACTIGRISLSGFIANLIAVPIAQIILYLGALSGVGGFVSPIISMKINYILDFLARILMEVAHGFASIPFANLPIDPLPAVFAVIWYLFFILLIENWRIGYRRRIIYKIIKKTDHKELSIPKD